MVVLAEVIYVNSRPCVSHRAMRLWQRSVLAVHVQQSYLPFNFELYRTIPRRGQPAKDVSQARHPRKPGLIVSNSQTAQDPDSSVGRGLMLNLGL